MTESTIQANIGPQIEPVDPEQAGQPALQERLSLSDSRLQSGQSGSPTKPTAPGRMPLFRR
jgi:hypothetical protein